MKIRCHNCYRVLNNDEEWCTRCGAHSQEIEEYLKNGTVPIDEGAICKKSFLFYFLFAFLLNGILSILFGVVFNSTNDIYLGEVGQSLPYAITYYSSINALLITSLITFTLMMVANSTDLLRYIKIKADHKLFVSLLIGSIVMFGFVLLVKYTPLTLTPNYFKEFLLNKTPDMTLKGSVNLIKIIVVMLFYALTEELIFRKAFINYLDQSTLMNDASIILLSSFVATMMMVTCFLLLVKATFVTYLYYIGTNLIFNLLLAINYFYNGRTLTSNIILRIVFLLLFIIILII